MFVFARPSNPRELAELCKSPKRLNMWLNGLFGPKYVKSNGIKSPEKFLKERSGDCAEFGVLAYETMRQMDGVSDLVPLFVSAGKDKKHLAVYYHNNNKKYHMSNWGVTELKHVNKMDQVAESIYEDWDYYRFAYYKKGKLKYSSKFYRDKNK